GVRSTGDQTCLFELAQLPAHHRGVDDPVLSELAGAALPADHEFGEQTSRRIGDLGAEVAMHRSLLDSQQSSERAQELLAGFYLRPHVAHFIWLLNTTIRVVSCTRQLIFEMCSDSRRGVGAGGPGGRAARRREPGSGVQPVRRSRSACSTAGPAPAGRASASRRTACASACCGRPGRAPTAAAPPRRAAATAPGGRPGPAPAPAGPAPPGSPTAG